MNNEVILNYDLMEWHDSILFHISKQDIPGGLLPYTASNGLIIKSMDAPELEVSVIYLRGEDTSLNDEVSLIHIKDCNYDINAYREALEELKNPHRELIKQWKEDEKNNVKAEWYYYDNFEERWIDLWGNRPKFSPHNEYRREEPKPRLSHDEIIFAMNDTNFFTTACGSNFTIVYINSTRDIYTYLVVFDDGNNVTSSWKTLENINDLL